MTIRRNHYEAAFEEYLRSLRMPYVAVDEKRRALMGQSSLKSLDFIVHPTEQTNLLVDIKGRRYPSGSTAFTHSKSTSSHSKGSGHKWENWATDDDISSMLQWNNVFGEEFKSILIFAYHILDERYLPDFEDWFIYQEKTYAFFGVWVEEYAIAMRTRSQSWATVSLPSKIYRELRQPIHRILNKSNDLVSCQNYKS